MGRSSAPFGAKRVQSGGVVHRNLVDYVNVPPLPTKQTDWSAGKMDRLAGTPSLQARNGDTLQECLVFGWIVSVAGVCFVQNTVEDLTGWCGVEVRLRIVDTMARRLI